MDTLFEQIIENKDIQPIGQGFFIRKKSDKEIELYHFDKILKTVPLKPREEFRYFIIELVLSFNIRKIRINKVLGISRQSIDNWIDAYQQYGIIGLIDSPQIPKGGKARELEKERKIKREIEKKEQLEINYCFNLDAGKKEIETEENPYIRENEYKPTRYAGLIIYIIALTHKWKWFQLVIGYFGNLYKIFLVFLLMIVRNITTIEQLKNIRKQEAGIILGLQRLPTRTKVWQWYYESVKKQLSQNILRDYFRSQILRGVVSVWFWFIDGHLLKYTGKEKVHKAFYTQRNIPYPGQTNIVTCDIAGNIVDFDIQEGKGDLRGTIISMEEKWKTELSGNHSIIGKEMPIKIFDREGNGVEFFSKAVKEGISFVTWEKNADKEKLSSIPPEKFKLSLSLNGKQYGIFEDEKSFCHRSENKNNLETGDLSEHKFSLRRIYLWNKTSNRRTSGLAYDNDNRMTTIDCAFGILNRWGASENTFKHLQTRHPFNYHPGFQFDESRKQDIANPDKKEKQKQLKNLKNKLNKDYKSLAKSKPSINKNGSLRKNSILEKTKQTIKQREIQVKLLQEEISKLPDRVDISSLSDSRSFKKRKNEGKYLFDFVSASVWNARNQLIEWLNPYFSNKNEIVDLLYAISNSHGWIKTTNSVVKVILEPLEQASRAAAQKQLCRKLTALATQTPTGKYFVVEVGDEPK